MNGHVGYVLKNSDGEVIDLWGGVWGQLPSPPGVIVLPNGDQVCAPVIGVEYSGCVLENWLMDEPPAPIPATISDRQFFQQAAIDGLVSQEEALSAVQTGSIPVVLQAVIDGIEDPNNRFAATMLLAGATTIERYHPLTDAVAAHLGWDSTQLDEFFIRAAQL